MKTVKLSATDDFWIVGDSTCCLIQNDNLSTTEDEVSKIIDSFVGCDVSVDDSGRVISNTGLYLGDIYE